VAKLFGSPRQAIGCIRCRFVGWHSAPGCALIGLQPRNIAKLMQATGRMNERTHRYGLSKLAIAMFEQCPKRLWLSVHRPELAEIDEGSAARFASGHEVGAIACSLLPNGTKVEAKPDLLAAVQAESRARGCARWSARCRTGSARSHLAMRASESSENRTSRRFGRGSR
jgi:hypothetical protein